MNTKLAELMAGLKPQPFDAYALAQERHPKPIAQDIERMARWLQIPGDGTGQVVTPAALAGLLGHGQEGLLRAFEGFTSETLRTEAESAACFDSLRRLARQARGMRLLDWDLDAIKLDRVSKPKLLVILEDRDLDERLRATAGARNETLSAFVSDSVRARLAEIEGRRAPAKPRAEREAASA